MSNATGFAALQAVPKRPMLPFEHTAGNQVSQTVPSPPRSPSGGCAAPMCITIDCKQSKQLEFEPNDGQAAPPPPPTPLPTATETPASLRSTAQAAQSPPRSPRKTPPAKEAAPPAPPPGADALAGFLWKGKAGRTKLARCTAGSSMQALFWTRRFFKVQPEKLSYWYSSPSDDANPPCGLYSLADLDEAMVRGREVCLHFLSVQKTGSRNRRRVELSVRASSEEEAECWANAIRAEAARLRQEHLPEEWDVEAMLGQSRQVRLVAKIPLPADATVAMQRLLDHTFMSKTTKDRRGNELPVRLKVVEVTGVQNVSAWTDYTRARASLAGESQALPLDPPVRTAMVEDRLTKDFLGELHSAANEHWLFHGTRDSAVEGITDTEFRIDLAGSNRGTLYGKGVYFAECCTKADEYAEEGADGLHRMLLCRVLLGRVLVDTERAPDPDELTTLCQSGDYDSLCGDRWTAVGTYREFILYDNTQVYPSYIINYRRMTEQDLIEVIRQDCEAGVLSDPALAQHAARMCAKTMNGKVKLAIVTLLATHSPFMVTQLRKFLEDERGMVRRAASDALKEMAGKIGAVVPVHFTEWTHKLLPELVEGLTDTNAEARTAAARVLGQFERMADPSIVAGLVTMLDDEDPGARWAAATSLGELGEVAASAVPVLAARLKDENDDVVRAACKSLGQFSPALAMKAVPELIECTQSSPNSKEAVSTLLHISTKNGIEETPANVRDSIVKAFSSCMKIGNIDSRISAVAALGLLGRHAAVAETALAGCLKVEPKSLQDAAKKSLCQLGQNTHSAVPLLSAACFGGPTHARVGAAKALGQMGSLAQNALPALIDCLDDPADEVRKAAATAVSAIGSSPGCRLLSNALEALAKACLSETVRPVRQHIAEQLGRFGTQAGPVLPQLLEAMAAGGGETRVGAALAVLELSLSLERGQSLSSEGLVPRLVTCMKSGGKELRRISAEALGALRATKAAPALVERLDDSDANVREAAAGALRRLGKEAAQAVPKLVELARDEQPNVRKSAARALAKGAASSGKEVVQKLIVLFKDGSPEIRASACFAVGLVAANAAAEPALRGLLSDGSEDVRLAAIKALGRMGSAAEPSVPGVANCFRDRSKAIRAAAGKTLSLLCQGKVEAASKALKSSLEEASSKVRQEAAKTLGLLGDSVTPCLPSLAAALKDDNEDVRDVAIKSFGQLGEHAAPALPSLLEHARDKDKAVRVAAIQAMGGLGIHAAKAAPELVKFLVHKSKTVRAAAAEAVGRLGKSATDAGAVASLGTLLEEADEEVRSSCVRALGRLGAASAPFAPNLVKLLFARDIQLRRALAGALRRIGAEPATAAPTLVLTCLRDTDPGVRQTAALAVVKLGKMAPEPATQALTDCLICDLEHAREEALRCLGKLAPHSGSAVHSIMECFPDKSRNVRAAAVQALGPLAGDNKRALPVLTEILSDTSASVRRAACESLGQLGNSAFSVVPEMIECLRDDNASVRDAAVGAIVRLGTAANAANDLAAKRASQTASSATATPSSARRRSSSDGEEATPPGSDAESSGDEAGKKNSNDSSPRTASAQGGVARRRRRPKGDGDSDEEDSNSESDGERSGRPAAARTKQ